MNRDSAQLCTNTVTDTGRLFRQHRLALALVQQLAATACTEENELLNTNAIKMTDAPFGRSDSEDDIIEEYDDVVNFKGTCCKGRTSLERGLFAVIIFLIMVIIGLAVGLTRPNVLQKNDYCESPQCIQAASSILSAMNPEMDPCDNFFQYACGGWLRQNPIPKGYHKWDRVQELSGKNLYVLKQLLDSNAPTKREAEAKVRAFYQSCMADGPATALVTMQHLNEIVDKEIGWSQSAQSNSSIWLFQTALERVHRLGAWPLFKVSVDVDERNPTKKHILKIDVGDTVLPSDMYPPLSSTATQHPSDIPNDIDNEGDKTSYTISSTTGLPITSIFSSQWKQALEVKKMFVDDVVPILEALGFNTTAAQQQAQSMADLEEKIAAAVEGKVSAYDRILQSKVFTVGELESMYGMIPWVQYFNALGFLVTMEYEVVVLQPRYLSNLTELVQSMQKNPSDLRLLRDYLAVTLLRSFQPYFDLGLFKMDETEVDAMQEQWKRCTFYTNKALGFATGAIFVRGTGQEGTVYNIQKLITYIREAFKEFTLSKFWIDKATRLKAEEKVNSIINKISYPSYIMNSSFLDMFYKEFKVQSENWLDNLLEWQKFELHRMNIVLQTMPDRKESWIRPPVTVNAYYSPVRNDVIFPIAMFHLPYYIPDGPSAVNFGAMGSVIGHEITHAFDIQGRQYDQEGRRADWWDPQTSYNFGITTQCMVNQYNQIAINGHKINGDFTLDENIADNGGLRAARYAYMKWIEEHKEELPLPSLNLSNYQVFFLSYAQLKDLYTHNNTDLCKRRYIHCGRMYCSKWTDMGLLLHLLTDSHSPGEARVNGVLANSKTFSWAYNCPVDTKMNSRTKCVVW